MKKMWTVLVYINKKLHKYYLFEINSAPSKEKWLERAQNYFNKKALISLCSINLKQYYI